MKQKKTKTLSSRLLSVALIITFIISTFTATAQIPNCQWGKTIGNALVSKKSVATDNFGNEYVTGFFRLPYIVLSGDTLFNKGTGTADYYVAKYNHLGNLIWARSGGGSQNDYPTGIATDSIGNIYLTGYYTSSGLILGHDTLKQPDNIFTMKYDPSGNVLWARGSVGAGLSNGIATDNAGNSYVTGIFGNPFIAFDHDTLYDGYNRIYNLFITKYTTDGTVEWVRGNKNLARHSSTQVSDIKIAVDGSLYVAGSFGGQMMVFGNDTVKKAAFSDYYIFLLKMDNSGNFTWVNGFGNFINSPYPAICHDESSNCFLSCTFSYWDMVFGTDTISGTSRDAILVKFNADGVHQWHKKTTFNCLAALFGAACDHSGNLYFTGQYSGHYLTFGSDTLAVNDSGSMFLIKYDNDGNQLWAKGGDRCNYDEALSIAIDPIDNIYLTGTFSGQQLLLDGVLMQPNDHLQPHAFLAKYSGAKTGINSTGYSRDIIVYPNPAVNKDNIIVAFPERTFTQMDIYNYLGQRLNESTILETETSKTIGMNNLAPGNYFIRLAGFNNIKTLPLVILP